MITQAIKSWLAKFFEWWPWGKSQENEYAPVSSPYNNGMTQESAGRSTIDAITPHPGVAPRITGQGETSCSTLDEWTDHTLQLPPAIRSSENTDSLQHPFSSLPTTPSPASSMSDDKHANSSNKNDTGERTIAPQPSTPTSEQQLEFLQYLVRRGLLNEGFAEGQVPDQYRTRSMSREQE
jgi:hypothetical protein